jgi:hypothetical protein
MFGAAVILLFLILLGGCRAGKPKEEIYGTWTNDTSTNTYVIMSGHIQKEVITPDGWKQYSRISDTDRLQEGTAQIESKRTDSEGNIWCKRRITVTAGNLADAGTKSQELDKLSKSATVWESAFALVGNWHPELYPTTIDPKAANYRIYYRAGK